MPTTNRTAETEFWLGAVIVFVTAVMQAVLLFKNANFTLHTFGTAFLIIYLAAATCYIVLPWLEELIDEFAHMTLTRWVLLGFCFWIGAEEMFDQAKAFHAPDGIVKAASLFTTPEAARDIAILISAFAALAVIEVLWHVHQHGARTVKKNLRRVRRVPKK